MSNPWEVVNNLNSKSANMMRESENDILAEKQYTPFIVNRAMSYHYDTIMIANIVNQWAHVDNRPQYEFYKSTVKPKKRYGKWTKPETNDLINMVSEYYNVNKKTAEQYLSLMSEDEKERIKNNNNKGGV